MAINKRKKLALVGFMLLISSIGLFLVITTGMVKDENTHMSTGKYTVEEIFEKYPVPKYLDEDIKAGKINYNDLPVPIQKALDKFRENSK